MQEIRAGYLAPPFFLSMVQTRMLHSENIQGQKVEINTNLKKQTDKLAISLYSGVYGTCKRKPASQRGPKSGSILTCPGEVTTPKG